MVNKKEVFKTLIDDKEVELAVINPSVAVMREAQIEYNKVFAILLKSGGILRETLQSYMVAQNLWNEEKDKQYDDIVKKMAENQHKINKGGIKLSEGKQIALENRKLRGEMLDLLSTKTSLSKNTVEGQAEDFKFDYLVSRCLVYNDTGKPIFKDVEDYKEHGEETYAILGAAKFATMFYGYDLNFEKNLPENQFLLKYKFIDENLRLINKDGKFVDEDGRLIDENGRFINEEGKFIDRNGNLIEESKPFLDDNGNPIQTN